MCLLLVLTSFGVQFYFYDFRIKLTPFFQQSSTEIIHMNEESVTEKELVKVKNYLQNISNKIKKDLNKIKPEKEKLVDLNNFKFKINSPVCESDEISVITVISSAPNNFHKRQAIRNTWGKPTDYLKHVFLLGETTEELFKNILEEQKQYSDIVQGNFIDAYRNLTYKHIMGLKWANRCCPNAKFVLKTDDDVFVHLYELKELLDKRLSSEKDLVSCLVNKNMPVLRDGSSKWYVSENEFKGSVYPVYCSGM